MIEIWKRRKNLQGGRLLILLGIRQPSSRKYAQHFMRLGSQTRTNGPVRTKALARQITFLRLSDRVLDDQRIVHYSVTSCRRSDGCGTNRRVRLTRTLASWLGFASFMGRSPRT
jgi:hypothetical protein